MKIRAIHQRMDQASIAQLDTWLDGIFDAQSLEALIGCASIGIGR